MPLYDFTCPACKQDLDDRVAGADEDVRCQCGEVMRRKISRPARRAVSGLHPKDVQAGMMDAAARVDPNSPTSFRDFSAQMRSNFPQIKARDPTK